MKVRPYYPARLSFGKMACRRRSSRDARSADLDSNPIMPDAARNDYPRTPLSPIASGIGTEIPVARYDGRENREGLGFPRL